MRSTKMVRQRRGWCSLSSTVTTAEFTGPDSLANYIGDYFKVVIERIAAGNYQFSFWLYETGAWIRQPASFYAVQITLAPLTLTDQFIPTFIDQQTDYTQLYIQTENGTLNDCPFYFDAGLI